MDQAYGVITGGVVTLLPAMSGALIFLSVVFPISSPSSCANTGGTPMVPR
jgi:hypothetical protein